MSVAIENLKKKHNLTEYQINNLTELLKYKVKGDLIYPGGLKSKLNIDIKKAYIILEDIKEMGYLTNIFEIYCRSCSKSKGIYVHNLSEIPKDIACDFCNHEFNSLDDTIALYRVIKDD